MVTINHLVFPVANENTGQNSAQSKFANESEEKIKRIWSLKPFFVVFGETIEYFTWKGLSLQTMLVSLHRHTASPSVFIANTFCACGRVTSRLEFVLTKHRYIYNNTSNCWCSFNRIIAFSRSERGFQSCTDHALYMAAYFSQKIVSLQSRMCLSTHVCFTLTWGLSVVGKQYQLGLSLAL